jgi:sugar transferase EpsL
MTRFVKRAIDLAGAAAGLLFLSPLLGILALAVRFTMGTPVLFRQTRPGYSAKPFILLKFRTMTDARNEREELLFDGERITKLGRWLRRTSLDELPGLWNVLKGEMSLVGPRPLLFEYLKHYSPEQGRRHSVKPGITGWAQVHGRNALSWEEKFALDLWYVGHASILLDMRILFKTCQQVLMQRGIAFEGHATMPRFGGRVPGIERESRKSAAQ